MTLRWKKWVNNRGIDGMIVWNPPKDGNCLFSVLSEAISPHLILSPDDLRHLAAKQILKEDEDIFQNVTMVAYRMEVDDGQFTGDWNPYKCETRQDFAKALTDPIKTQHWMGFQGDDIVLSLLAKALNIEIIAFDQKNPKSYTCISFIDGCDEKYQKDSKITAKLTSEAGFRGSNDYTIFIFYENRGCKHYQSLGVPRMNGDGEGVQTIFLSKDLPRNVADFLDMADCERLIKSKVVR